MVARGAQWLGRVWKNFPCGELCHTTFFPFISRADCDTFCPNCGGTVLFASKQVNGALLNQLFNTRLEAFMWWSGVNACQPSFLKLLPWIFCVVCCNSGSVWSIIGGLVVASPTWSKETKTNGICTTRWPDSMGHGST